MNSKLVDRTAPRPKTYDLYPKQKKIFDYPKNDQEQDQDDGNIGNGSVERKISRAFGFKEPKEDETKLLKKSKLENLKDLELDGFSSLAEATTMCGRIFWFIFLIIVLLILTYEIYKTIDGYVNQPILTTYTITKNASMKLPVVLLCPGNFINQTKYETMSQHDVWAVSSFMVSLVDPSGNPKPKKKAGQNRQKRSLGENDADDEFFFDMNMDSFGAVEDEYNNEWPPDFSDNEDLHLLRKRSVSSTNATSPKNATSKARLAYTNQTFSYDEVHRAVMEMGFDKEQIFLNCQFFANGVNHNLNCSDIVQEILDANYGKCYVVTLPDELVQTTESKALSLTINTLNSKNSRLLDAIKRYVGFFLSIDSELNPVSWEKILVGKGYIKMDIDLEHIQMLNVEGGDTPQPCVKNDEVKLEIFNSSYSSTLCQLDCFVQQVVDKCKCLLTTEKRFIKTDLSSKMEFCSFLESKDCVVPNVTNNPDAIDAVNQCRSRCHVQCDSWRYKMNPSTASLNPAAFGHYSDVPFDDLLQIDLSFKTLEYSEFIQSYQITVDTFIGNLGGQITLWIGGSMITLVNVPIWIWSTTFRNFCRRWWSRFSDCHVC